MSRFAIQNEAGIRQQAWEWDDVKERVAALPPLRDVKVAAKDIALKVIPETNSGVILKVKRESYNFHDNALRQVHQKLHYPANQGFNEGISQTTRQHVLDDLTQSYIKNVDKRTQQQKNLFLRFDSDDRCVAFLSERYNKFDIPNVVEGIDQAFLDLSWEKVITNFYLEDHHLNMRVNFPDHAVKDPNGYELWPALFVSNDETGNGAIHIHLSLYRLVCGNGLLYMHQTSENKAYHTKATQDIAKMVRYACIKLPDFVRDFEGQMNSAYDKKVPQFESANELQDFVGKTNLSRDEASNVLEHWQGRTMLEEVPQYNLWSLSQAIASAANDYPQDRAVMLERLATQVLSKKF